MEKTTDITVYWVTRDPGLILRLMQSFGMERHLSVNYETDFRATSGQLDRLRDGERKGIIQIRTKKQ